MNYSQFLNMIPEATLMVVLLITFIADFCSSKSADRKWFNPLVCLLMVAHIAINIFPTEATEAFGGMYTTGPAGYVHDDERRPLPPVLPRSRNGICANGLLGSIR